MSELLKNVWPGWQSITNHGKLAGALLISLLFLWIYYEGVRQKTFLIYTTVVTLCCIVPATAVLLERYQTWFYDYRWIWSIVPMTAMIAFGAALFLTEFLQKTAKGEWRRQFAAAVLLAAGLTFCGGMGAKPWEGYGEQEQRQKAETLMTEMQERLQGRQIRLWAPKSVLEYVRAYDAGIQLLYGRNMWEPELNVYSYDTYSKELQDMYQWMEAAPGDEMAADSYCAAAAMAAEVNCILVPVDKQKDSIERFEEILGVEAEKLEGYYLFVR